jgi:hypothetical protein
VRSHQLGIEPYGPFRLDLTAWAPRREARNAVDRWDTATYERVASLNGGPTAPSVTQVAGPDAPVLSARLAGRPVDQEAEGLARGVLSRLFGLSVDLSPFAALAAPDPLLGPLVARMRRLKPPVRSSPSVSSSTFSAARPILPRPLIATVGTSLTTSSRQ